MMPSAKVLVLTVGTGNVDRLEESLFQPLEKSLRDGNWKEAVLLPSTMTEANAEEFKDRMHDYSIQILPLPEDGQENDADACFIHFDRVLNTLLERGYEPSSITPDFTRGTKAMSAALVLAAVRHNIPTLRYIHGARDSRGMVLAGAEEVSEVATERATTRHRIDDARQLMCKGAFAAGSELLRDVHGSESEINEIAYLQKLAAFWSAWDRLDYEDAKLCAAKLGAGTCRELEKEITCVGRLAEQPDQNQYAAIAEWLCWAATDLLANGRRRIRNEQFEDAILRAYRVLELIGQIRLFAKGYDSARINPGDPKVKAFRRYARKNKHEDLLPSKEHPGFLTAPKMSAARFLKYLGDPFGKKLVHFDDGPTKIKANRRNRSILIRGFSAIDFDEVSLSGLYDRIEALLGEAVRDDNCSNEIQGFNSVRFGIVPAYQHATSQSQLQVCDGEQDH